MNTSIWIALIVMGGIVLSIVAWQLLSIGKAAATPPTGYAADDLNDLRRRLQALESDVHGK
jgi:hypothetical protein